MTSSSIAAPTPFPCRARSGRGGPDTRANGSGERAARHRVPPNLVPVDRGGEADATRRGRPVGVLIAHGQSLARTGLRLLIGGEDDLAVVGEAVTGEQAVALARRRLPDVVVMDLGLPGADALEATRSIVADPQMGHVRVLVLTPADSDESILGPLRAGADGLLVGDSDAGELLSAMPGVSAGQAPLSPSLIGAVIADVASRPEPPRSTLERVRELTAREREVVALVAAGLDNREIAHQLDQSRHRQDAPQPGDAQAPCSRPFAARGLRLPQRPRGTRRRRCRAPRRRAAADHLRAAAEQRRLSPATADRLRPAAVAGLPARSQVPPRPGALVPASA